MNYVKVAQVADVGSDEALHVETNGHKIALLKYEDQIYAVSDVCTHEFALLSEGFVEGPLLECPMHGSMFDCRTGEVKSLPATTGLPTFPVKVEGDDVLVGIEDDQT